MYVQIHLLYICIYMYIRTYIYTHVGVTAEDEKAALEYVYALVYPDPNVKIIDKNHNIRIVRQGCEPVTYRRNFKVHMYI